jgi:hypothetical protein
LLRQAVFQLDLEILLRRHPGSPVCRKAERPGRVVVLSTTLAFSRYKHRLQTRRRRRPQ